LAANVAEYFTEEKPGIARRQDVSAYCEEVEALQRQLLRLELRIAALEG
jgi:ubiquinone biosynthesis protein UbiJ